MASAATWMGSLGWGWMPPNGALHGFALDHLMKINLLLICGVLVLAHVLLISALLLRGPRQRADKARLRRIFAIEILALASISGIFVWMTIAAQRLWAANRYAGPSPEAMQVESVGIQFQWYFRYPGTDATFGRFKPELVDAAGGNPLGIDPEDPDGRDDVVSSELVLPVGREVDLRLRSQDVIHGFFIPGMRLKQNAVPGMVLHIHFTPVVQGEYPIVCSQLCGIGHERMHAQLRVVSASEYRAWLAAREKARLAQGGGE